MSSLHMISTLYASDDSSDEDYPGFDLETKNVERFFRREEETLKNFRSFFNGSSDLTNSGHVETGSEPTENINEPPEQITVPSIIDPDSDGSFFDSDRNDEKTRATSRKRTKKEIRKLDTARKRRLAHNVILGDCGCSKECVTLVSKDDRIDMNKSFWELDAAGQKCFIRERVNRGTVEKRSRYRFTEENLRKRHSYIFHIRTVASDESPIVCRKFFLNTLGYGEHCGNIIYRLLDDTDDLADEDGDAESKAPKRGKYVRNTEKRDSVKAHINKYNPTISHYRRLHAPNRLYLPSDLSKKAMHSNYKETHKHGVSYQFYGQIMRDMNISLVKLGHEQCESCVSATQHQKASGHSTETLPLDSTCVICEKYLEHLQLAKASRAEYRDDGESVKSGTVVLAVDLQKVIQLPRLDGLKTIVFSQRLIAFNETFAPVGKYTRTTPVFACVWNEAVSGRSSNDILGCFHRIITRFKDVEKLVLWLDNCAAQNKNWNLFLHMIILMNSKDVQMKELVLKYFESGHTFMSADSFHAAVEGAMKQNPPITYSDFKDVVKKSKDNVEVMDMLPDHFFPNVFNVSQYVLNKLNPRPYIDKIRNVAVKKGSYDFHYSSSVDGQNQKSCKILTAKQEKTVSSAEFNLEENLKRRSQPKGIDGERKITLLKTIVPLVDEDKKTFWIELPEQVQQPGNGNSV